MEFAFTEEQQMIRESAEGFLADLSNSEAIRAAMATEQGYDDALWQRICTEMYWQALHIPEDHGGMGLGFVELAALFEQMGRFLLCSPFFSTCLATNTLLVAASDEQKAAWLPGIAEGSTTATLAYTGTAGGWGADAVTLEYSEQGDGVTLNGTLRYVPDGHTASLLVVAARRADSMGEEGIGLFIVPADSAGIAREYLPTMDQTRKQAQIAFSDVAVPAVQVLPDAGSAWPVLQKSLQLAQVCVAAEQMGGAQQILDMTVEYTKEREQFGRSIASFQAVKHKMADMMLKCEVSRSAVYYAACVAQDALFDNPDSELAGELPDAAAMAKTYCSDAYFFNAGNAVQLYGGVGFTWEYDVHLYFKRARSSEAFLGNGAYHREQIAARLLD